MTQEEILEGNKLIAEFMKPASYDKRRKDYPFPFPVIEIVPAEKIMGYGGVPEGEIKHFSGQLDMMKYHSSWDWLIPVINKIYESDEYYKWKETSGQFEKEVFINTKFIKETWKQIVEFINWYNNEKK